MRAGGCTVQQSLTAEAASVVKQALTLARRRGHAQVTPLHVANTMLSASTGLLRTACLQSHSHPLQCKALELCFNVALNRLPASSSSPMLGLQSQHPSISNALVAAFKRAQAHQRRGTIDNQQQPLLAIKIELEQLIISILDDPSVSRVMREAGFSSTQVKSNVEQAVSLEFCSRTPTPSGKCKQSNLLDTTQPPPTGQIGAKVSKPRVSHQIKNEDVMNVINSLTNKRRKSFVIVGECLAIIEGAVEGMMDKVEKGDVPEALKEVKFISLPLFSVEHLSREDVEVKLGELRSLVTSMAEKGVVLYLGDLTWITEYRATSSAKGNSYCHAVEHMILEIGKLVSGYGESGKCWLLGIATFHTFMRCRTGHPSLETVWGLQPITVPAGSLSLSLIPDSNEQSESRCKNTGNLSSQLLFEGGDEKQLICCADCSSKYEVEARNLQNSSCNGLSASSRLPSWLKDENKRQQNCNDQDCVSVRDLRIKWNSICSSVHKLSQSSERTLSFTSASPSSSTSCFSSDHQQYPDAHQTNQIWPVQSCRDHQCPRLYFNEHRDARQAPSSNPSCKLNSACSSDAMEMEYLPKFKEFSSENLNALCSALEEKVPWQKEIIPEIVGTILQCRSGMLRRKDKLKSGEAKEETWLFFQGVDVQAKEKIARELAKVVFGSHSNFVSISLSSFSSTRADSTEDTRNKRTRDEQSCSYIKRFAEAVSINPHSVFLVEDIEQADYCSQVSIKRAIERGRVNNSNGEEVIFSDAIIILSCESFSSRSRACSPPSKQKSGESEDAKTADRGETSPSVSLDLNISFDDDTVEDQSIDDIGLLESVDRRIIFKIQEL